MKVSLLGFGRNLSTSTPVFMVEGGGSMFFRNVGRFLPDYTASHTRRQ
jgi:hypothetical protein